MHELASADDGTRDAYPARESDALVVVVGSVISV
jgi:hypothetical protein